MWVVLHLNKDRKTFSKSLDCKDLKQMEANINIKIYKMAFLNKKKFKINLKCFVTKMRCRSYPNSIKPRIKVKSPLKD